MRSNVLKAASRVIFIGSTLTMLTACGDVTAPTAVVVPRPAMLSVDPGLPLDFFGFLERTSEGEVVAAKLRAICDPYSFNMSSFDWDDEEYE